MGREIESVQGTGWLFIKKGYKEKEKWTSRKNKKQKKEKKRNGIEK
jgi:hypothetical protein